MRSPLVLLSVFLSVTLVLAQTNGRQLRGDPIGQDFENVGQDFENVGHNVKNAFDDLGHDIKKGYKEIGDGFKKAFHPSS